MAQVSRKSRFGMAMHAAHHGSANAGLGQTEADGLGDRHVLVGRQIAAEVDVRLVPESPPRPRQKPIFGPARPRIERCRADREDTCRRVPASGGCRAPARGSAFALAVELGEGCRSEPVRRGSSDLDPGSRRPSSTARGSWRRRTAGPLRSVARVGAVGDQPGKAAVDREEASGLPFQAGRQTTPNRWPLEGSSISRKPCTAFSESSHRSAIHKTKLALGHEARRCSRARGKPRDLAASPAASRNRKVSSPPGSV